MPIEIARVPADPPVGTAKKDDVIPIRGEFVALLNNDVIVTAAWLERLIALIASAPNIGMVAPMSNHGPQALRVDSVSYSMDEWDSANDPAKPSENGLVRLPRSSLLPLIDRVNRFAAEWHERHANDKLEPETLGGGCVVIRREVLRKLGLFPTRTPLGTFDTTSLATRVLQAGFRLGACGDLFVHSFGSRG